VDAEEAVEAAVVAVAVEEAVEEAALPWKGASSFPISLSR
jgi:hypothetical protein